MKHSGICKNCGCSYERERPLRGVTCSRKCSSIFFKSKVEQRICKNCGLIFIAKPCEKKVFCSIGCFNKSQFRGKRNKIPMILTCQRCSCEFKRHPGQIKRKFCSVKCARNSKIEIQKNFTCLTCGKNFIDSKKRKYCSSSCSRRHYNKTRKMENLINGFLYNTKEAKRFLFEKFKSCQLCNWSVIPEILELHHKDRNRNNNHISNLLLICPNCHSIEHWKDKTGQFKNNLGKKIK